MKVRKISHTKSIGAGRAEQRSNMVSESQENVIEPHEVGELKKIEIIALYRGGKAQGIGTPYFEDFKKYWKRN